MIFKIKYFDEIDSTNEEAIRRYLDTGVTFPVVVAARYQTFGKGYGNNVWESEKDKNLLFSLAFKPEKIIPSEQFLLTIIISLSLADIAGKMIPDKVIKIKWPNDIYVNDKKIAGILIRNFIQSNGIDYSVIGIGFNVNQKRFSEKVPNPTSVILETGEQIDLILLLNDILDRFLYYYEKVNVESILLREKYLNKLYRFGKKSEFIDKDKNNFYGVIVGVSEYGQLLVETNDGKKVFDFKEIEFVI
jgi:BirA family biotin operon repressor/biotin-[acetyl-CoA-carboxylase] ligase